MISLKFDITDYQPEHLDILLTFYKTSRELGFIKSNSLELQDWLCDKLYYDDQGNIGVKVYWPDFYCQGEQCYDKIKFVAWQLAGYEIKEKLDAGIMRLVITDGKDNYVPVWGTNKKRKYKENTIRGKIKATKADWNKKRDGRTYRCKLRGGRIEQGYIRICCVCNWKDWLILKKAA